MASFEVTSDGAVKVIFNKLESQPPASQPVNAPSTLPPGFADELAKLDHINSLRFNMPPSPLSDPED